MNDRLLNLEKLMYEVASSSETPVGDAVALLPNGIAPQDVLRYTMHQLKLQEKERLITECAAVEAENEGVARSITEGKARIEQKLKLLDEKRREIRKSADVCCV